MSLSDKTTMTNRYGGVLTEWKRTEDIRDAVKRIKDRIKFMNAWGYDDVIKIIEDEMGEKLI